MTAKENTFFCIDMKTFYASVECAERGLNPFETNLVVADLTRGTNALCLAISPKMKAQGVKNRCRLSEIPNSIKYDVAPPWMQLYIDYAADIYGLYLKYFERSDIHVYSIDESFIDVTGYLKTYNKTPRELAKFIMDEIANELHIPSTVGIGTKGKEACASHCISEDLLKRAVLFDIQSHIKMIENEKDDLIEKLSALKYEFEQDSKTDVTAQIKKTKKRIAEINHMVKQLFEEKVTGSIPESMYKTMVAQYCEEKDDLCAELDTLEKTLDKQENEEVDILRWVDNMLAFVDIKELDRDTVLTLIDHVEVHETGRIDGKKQFRISVFYKFVGNIHSEALDAA